MFFKKKEYNNQFYLYAQNFINILFPLIVFFYLIPIVGKEKFGVIIYYQTITSLIALFIDFGFDILGIQLISRFNTNYLSNKILVNTLFFKSILIIISLIIILLFIPYNSILIYSLWVPIFSVFFPQWYFIGMKLLKKATHIAILHKIIIIILLLFFVKTPTDFNKIPLAFFISTIMMIIYIFSFKIFDLKLNQISLKHIRFLFRYMFKTYISTLLFLVVKSLPKVLLGKLGLFEFVTYFDLSEKLSKFLKIPNQITTRLLIQKFTLNFNYKTLIYFFKRSLMFTFFMLSVFNLLLEKIILFLDFPLNHQLIYSCRLLSIAVFFVFLNNVLGQQVLVSLNKFEAYYKSLFYSSIISLIIFLILYILNFVNPISLAFNLVFMEIMVLIFLLVNYFKNNRYAQKTV